jgi:hypothetical protein
MSEVKTSLLDFPDAGSARRPGVLFWTGALFLFAAIHSPPARIVATFHLGTEPIWASTRSWICFVALLVLALQLAPDLWRYARANGRELLVSLVIAAAIFPLLCLLIHPFSINDHGKVEMGRGWGLVYATMSRNPLAENNELFYRRLLQPLLANWLHLRGLPNYGWFSLGCTFTLLSAQIHFLRMRSGGGLMPANRLWQNAIIVVGLATCAQIMVGIEWPGYPEQIAFLFLLIPAFIPMSSAGRLTAATLALSGFDGVVFPLAAAMVFCFPRRDRLPGFVLIASYAAMFVLSYGFKMIVPLELHETIGQQSYIGDLVRYPYVILFAIFAAFKFFWLVVPMSIYAASKARERRVALGLLILTFSFGPLLLLAWDTTRLTSFSFVGLLLCVVALYQLDTVGPTVRCYMLPAIGALSLLFPSYNIFLLLIHHNFDRPGTRIFREAGVYRVFANHLPFDLPDERSPEEKTATRREK